MKAVNLAIVGFGRIGKIHAENIISSNYCNLKLIVDPFLDENEHYNQLGIKQSKKFEDLLIANDINGVVLCSPSKHHVEQIKKLSKTIKNIFCEKPLGLSVQEILDVKSEVEKNNLNLHVGFNRRYDPDFADLQQSIENNEVGDIHMIKITSRDPAPPPIDYIKTSGGIFLDMTIHDFDMIKYLSNSEISEIYVKGGCFIDPQIKKAGDVDTAIISMKLKSGVLATINNSRKAVYGYDQRIEVLGSRGILKVPNRLLSGLETGSSNGFIKSNPKTFSLIDIKNHIRKKYSILSILSMVKSLIMLVQMMAFMH